VPRLAEGTGRLAGATAHGYRRGAVPLRRPRSAGRAGDTRHLTGAPCPPSSLASRDINIVLLTAQIKYGPRPPSHDDAFELKVTFCVRGVVSPLLANLFLHDAFDAWMRRTFPHVQFERYADDAIVHCSSERQARAVLDAIRGRFGQCELELHATKTRIVYCKDDDRPGEHEHTAFDFLGYTFQPRRAKNRWGKFFVSFLPAMSAKAAKRVRTTIREWRMASTRNNQRLEDLARVVNPVVRGWMNYYGRFYRSKCVQVLRHLNEALAAWARRKYRRFHRRERASMHWLGGIARRDPRLFVLWQLGMTPAAGL
jgi:RNA-directed DNA polymerase